MDLTVFALNESDYVMDAIISMRASPYDGLSGCLKYSHLNFSRQRNSFLVLSSLQLYVSDFESAPANFSLRSLILGAFISDNLVIIIFMHLELDVLKITTGLGVSF